MERLLSAVLTGAPTELPGTSVEYSNAFLAAVARHGVQALVAYRVRTGVLSNVPPSVAQALSKSAVVQAAVEEVFAAELRRVIAALSAEDVPALLMKGGALAYTHYPDASLRPRTDTDLMLRRDDVERAGRVFEGLGYEPFNLISGSLVMDQCTWTKTDPIGLRHVYDLHWKIVNARVASELLGWDTLAEKAIALPTLDPSARAFGNAHALLLACVHRVVHHFADDRMLWLYDIHLLVMRMDDADWREFTRVSLNPAASAMCRRSLAATAALFRTTIPPSVAAHLDAHADDAALEAFVGSTRRVDLVLSDLRALPGWRSRVRLLREHLFPPAAFMKRQYGVSNAFLLPVLYARRCVVGARRWIRPVRPDIVP